MKFRATIILMYLTSVFWAVFAVTWLFGGKVYRIFYFVNGLGFAVVLFILTYYLNKKYRWAWWVAIIMAGINIVLTITDQVGWFDLAYLVPAIALFVMLIVIRKEVNGKKSLTGVGDEIVNSDAK
ncbi:MAG: hypothetical protein PHY34_03080 [Patescibacteria group bacterium]|nr:hypothetical protein [Patescibacteria group bacterium]MDD5716141.1 hypothetical protein [Patescibacteria group bacterium]